MDENLEEEEILSVISKRLDADLRINIQTNKRRIFEEKSSLHASNPIVSPIISRCSAHTHTHTHTVTFVCTECVASMERNDMAR